MQFLRIAFLAVILEKNVKAEYIPFTDAFNPIFIKSSITFLIFKGLLKIFRVLKVILDPSSSQVNA